MCEVVGIFICVVKECNLFLLLIGYVIKDGFIVGFWMFEYFVDVVCSFEGDW